MENIYEERIAEVGDFKTEELLKRSDLRMIRLKKTQEKLQDMVKRLVNSIRK